MPFNGGRFPLFGLLYCRETIRECYLRRCRIVENGGTIGRQFHSCAVDGTKDMCRKEYLVSTIVLAQLPMIPNQLRKIRVFLDSRASYRTSQH